MATVQEIIFKELKDWCAARPGLHLGVPTCINRYEPCFWVTNDYERTVVVEIASDISLKMSGRTFAMLELEDPECFEKFQTLITQTLVFFILP